MHSQSYWYSHLLPVFPLLEPVENVYLGEYEDDDYPKEWFDEALVAALTPFDVAIAGSSPLSLYLVAEIILSSEHTESTIQILPPTPYSSHSWLL